ncbi:DUF7282 domain-containing protein [Halosimplex pelagicum]|uniref:DUF7282 domain-containing protein n=1 Tax=Halosimplex pelagicum TaxID=869886 RepID=A0A7D5TBX8_9EURY|nr:hypothetical protein [Halosimplex pelagicum]QLH82469.1 hypothetical protein HZS54_12965 [Halosimplex pelagicum]QLH82525.1 hypothetical protein HZS54_13270 [Halosimplex pelagicum]
MTNDDHDLRVSARTARLTAGASDDGPPYRFSGVAVAAGDILHMDDGTPVLFAADELQQAAETQAGEPLTADHPTDEDGRPVYPPPTDETVGKVSKAGWLDDQQAVGYEATAHDEEVAQGVQAGSYEVSVHPQFALGEQDIETGAYKATNIRFRDLSVVSKGDSPNNTAEWGPNEALASFTQGTDIGAELTAADAGDDVDDERGLVKRLAEHFGLLDSNDRRGGAYLPDQTTGGETIVVDDASFDDAPWLVTLHGAGDEFPDVGEGLGPALGASQPYDAGDYETEFEIALNEALAEDQTLFALLRYHADGEPSDPIPRSEGGYYLDSGFVAVAPDGVMDSDEAGDEVTADASTGDEPAESGTDADTDSDMGSNSDSDENGSNEQDSSSSDEGDSKTLGDMTVDELGEALRDQGFVTEDGLEEAVAAAQDRQSKRDKVDEIIAESDDYDEDDREDLLASAHRLVEREHKRVRGELAAQLPGSAGAAPTLTASAGSDDASADDYGTGVQED